MFIILEIKYSMIFLQRIYILVQSFISYLFGGNIVEIGKNYGYAWGKIIIYH